MRDSPVVPLVDTFGRVHRDLRISVTDRCNYRCTYCMPEDGLEWLPRHEVLSFEEIELVASVLVRRFGIDSIRITGGEPTVRANVTLLVSKLAGLSDPTHPIDLSMTTNGSTLRRMATDLRDAGLGRLNISLDSLHADRFEHITRRDDLDTVLDGIDAAVEAGFDPVKLNVVAMAGINDDEILDFASFGRDRGVTVRFIEFMPLDADGAWTDAAVMTQAEIVSVIDEVHPLEPIVRGSEPAERFRYRDGRGEVGVIPSVTRPFCESCDRIRLTSEGGLRNCLFATDEVDLRAVMRSGEPSETVERELVQAISSAVAAKGEGHAIGKVNFIRPRKSMSQIGG
ncbi:MAG: GTP 3',8-cyclase MoaA [Microthrixaceae bacterium]